MNRDKEEMTPLQEAIYASAYVDAFRSMFDGFPKEQRTRMAHSEAMFVVTLHKEHVI